MDNTLEFWQAIKLVSEGEKVARLSWNYNVEYIYLEKYYFGGMNCIMAKLQDGRKIIYNPSWEDMVSSNWYAL